MTPFHPARQRRFLDGSTPVEPSLSRLFWLNPRVCWLNFAPAPLGQAQPPAWREAGRRPAVGAFEAAGWFFGESRLGMLKSGR